MYRLGAAVVGIVFAVFVLSMAATGGAAAQEEEQVTLTINVTDSNGDPIGGVDVEATWDGGEAEATTVSNGRTFIDVPAGAEVDITVEDDQYVRDLQPVTVQNAEEQEVDIRMSLSGNVEFVVTDTDNEESIENARLFITHPDSVQPVDVLRTGSDGTVTLEGVEQRAFEVELSRAQYYDENASFTLDSAGTTQSYEMERGFTRVDFEVTDSHFSPGEPLEGARVEIEETGDVLTTRSDGIQDTRLPVNDDYTVSVDKEGYDGVTATLELGEERREFSVSIERTPSITISTLNDAVVVGQQTQVTVTNAYDEPVENAAITLNGDTLGQTDASGSITFELPQTDNNTVEASYRGLEDSVIIEGVGREQDPDDDTTDDDSMTDDNTTDDDSSDDDEDNVDDDTGTTDDGEGDSDSLGPGFGIVAGAVALLASGLLARRRM